MISTYEKIASVTVGSGGAANIEFTSIPGTYDDLILVASLRGDNATIAVGSRITYNNNAANYSERLLYGDGTSALSANRTGTYTVWGGNAVGSTATASTFSTVEIYIPNYAGSTNKSASHISMTENNATAAQIYADATLWANTAAITSIKLTADAGNYVQHSTAFLYGIKKS